MLINIKLIRCLFEIGPTSSQHGPDNMLGYRRATMENTMSRNGESRS